MVWSMSNRPADLLLFVTHSFAAFAIMPLAAALLARRHPPD
jgi:hypothetical protein